MLPEKWRLIESGALCGSLNMAIDEALLASVAAGESAPVLRIYRWNPATLTLGYGQRQTGQFDSAFCRTHGIDVVRRPTGGRAVLHDREVTYAVISPETSLIFPGGILENYRVISRPLQRALAACGLQADLVPGRKKGATPSRQSACFIAPSSYELIVNGCKMTGGAQKRLAGAFLQHGSIPVDLDLQILRETVGSTSPAACRQLETSVGWINRWRETPITIEEVEKAVIAAFASELPVQFETGSLTLAERQHAESLAGEKYVKIT